MRLNCSGEIISSDYQWLYDWFEIPAFSPAKLREALGSLGEGEELTLEINSPGGDCYAGFEIYSLLRQCKGRTVAEVQSMAASAASTILMGCRERLISPVAQVMIHDPWCTTAGNSGDMRWTAGYLDSVKESILNAYELRCGGKCDRARLSELMSEETWLTAQDAVALGLCDRLLTAEDDKLSPNSCPTSFAPVMNAASCHDVGQLLSDYQKAVRDGQSPAEGHPVEAETPAPAPAEELSATDSTEWAMKARLHIEKNRF